MNKEDRISLEMAVASARLMDEQKAENIRVLNVAKTCNFTDYFILATANSSLQLRALGGKLQRELRERGRRPMGVAGLEAASWLVLDYGDMVIHVFSAEARDYYRLEDLWGDAEKVDWTEAV